MASPMPPKRRPRPPFKSRKPRCSRAGTDTVTPSLMGVERLKRRSVFRAAGLSHGQNGFRLDEPALATRTVFKIDIDGRPQDERTKQGTHLQRPGSRGAAQAGPAALVPGRRLDPAPLP